MNKNRDLAVLEKRIANLENRINKIESFSLKKEMAYNKKAFKHFVEGRTQQIAENWCLCMYCKKYRADLKTTYIHWRSELESYLGYLNSLSLEKPRHRSRMAAESMITDADMDDPDVVFKTCCVKFRHENENKQQPLNMSLEHQKEVCALFAQQIDDIIECIGSNSIFTYTRSVFPDTYTISASD